MDRDEVSNRILNYLASHPDSADTLEGIVTWWIMRDFVALRVEEARCAVEHLVAIGAIREQNMGDGRITYVAANRGGG